MTLSEFCEYNGIKADGTFVMLDHCNVPDFETTLGFTLVMFAKSGSATFRVGGKEYEMRRRYISFLREGNNIEMLSASDNFNAVALLIGGDLDLSLRVSNVFLTLFVMEDKPFLKASAEYAEAIRIFFEALGRVTKFDNNPYRDDCLQSLLRAFFYSTGYYLFESLRFKSNDLYTLSSRFPQYEDSVVSRFLALVENCSSTQRTLAFYADKMDYNPKYLSALIKKETGITGQSLIDQYAILKAMAKLSYSDKSIKEISNDMEFPSQSDFGKYFKRVTGQSPLAYRKSRRLRH